MRALRTILFAALVSATSGRAEFRQVDLTIFGMD